MCEENEGIPDSDDVYKIRLYQVKRDLCLQEGGSEDIIADYMELVIQYGFISLFSVVFPLASFFSLLANIL